MTQLMREEKLNEVKKERMNGRDKEANEDRMTEKKGEKGKRESETDEPPATMSLY